MESPEIQAELDATTTQLASATAELETLRKEVLKHRETTAKAEAAKFIAELVAKQPLAFGKTEAEKFAALYEAAKVAMLSENAELVTFATAQLAALETYASAKAPVVPTGENKPAPVTIEPDTESPTAEDFRAYDRGDKAAAVKIDTYVKAQCAADKTRRYAEVLKAARVAVLSSK